MGNNGPFFQQIEAEKASRASPPTLKACGEICASFSTMLAKMAPNISLEHPSIRSSRQTMVSSMFSSPTATETDSILSSAPMTRTRERGR